MQVFIEEKIFMTLSKPNILVLDGDHKNALAIVRHFGSEYNIDVISHSKYSVCFFSKFVKDKYIVSNPKKDEEGFVEDLFKILKKKNYLLIIPVSYISYQICSRYKKRIKTYTHITIADYKLIDLASNKIETYKLAEQLIIPYPKTYYINRLEELDNLKIDFPCVIKAPFEAGKNIVEYANDKEDLKTKYKKICKDNGFVDTLPIIQEYIQGSGAGFFAFYKNGELKNYFMHRRIREYPVTGGASTVAESFYDENILYHGKKILDFLKWEGVAMVEFKRDDKIGEFKLMEINAKLWGSLDLALESGVDFIKMLIEDALGKEIEKVKDYKNIRFQWILNGDLFHIIERPWKLPAFIKDLLKAKNDIWLEDIKPNLFQLIYIPIHYYKKILK